MSDLAGSAPRPQVPQILTQTVGLLAEDRPHLRGCLRAGKPPCFNLLAGYHDTSGERPDAPKRRGEGLRCVARGGERGGDLRVDARSDPCNPRVGRGRSKRRDLGLEPGRLDGQGLPQLGREGDACPSFRLFTSPSLFLCAASAFLLKATLFLFLQPDLSRSR